MQLVMKRSLTLAAAALCVVAAACTPSSQEPASMSRAENGTPVPVQPLDSSARQHYQHYSGLEDPMRTVVRDQAAWQALWARMVTVTPRPPAPTVDFAREMLLVAAMGTRSTGGHSIGIGRAYEKDDRLHAVVQEVSPGANCMTTQALTAPVAVVRVARRDGDVTFVDERTVKDCE